MAETNSLSGSVGRVIRLLAHLIDFVNFAWSPSEKSNWTAINHAAIKRREKEEETSPSPFNAFQRAVTFLSSEETRSSPCFGIEVPRNTKQGVFTTANRILHTRTWWLSLKAPSCLSARTPAGQAAHAGHIMGEARGRHWTEKKRIAAAAISRPTPFERVIRYSGAAHNCHMHLVRETVNRRLYRSGTICVSTAADRTRNCAKLAPHDVAIRQRCSIRHF